MPSEIGDRALSCLPPMEPAAPQVQRSPICSLFLDLNALPKRDVAFDVLGSVFGFGIVPRGIGIGFAIYLDRVVAGGAFPGAVGMSVAGLKILLVDRVWWKILVAFHDFTAVTFGQYGTVPSCFRHSDWGLETLNAA